MAIKERAWEVARRAGKRCFYEHGTKTIRTQPENYCLAAWQGGRWIPFVDAALDDRRRRIAIAIARNPHATPSALTQKLAAIVAGRRRR